MLGLIQRVNTAAVKVNNDIIGSINKGILLFLGVEKKDTTDHADKLLHKILNYRIFSDQQEHMNLALKEINGSLLIVPQFTLAADTQKGLRPSFSSAATPEQGRQLFDYFVTQAKQQHPLIATGEFGAYMQVTLCNDGPVTFLLTS